MTTQDLVSVAVSAGFDVEEYEGCFAAKKTVDLHLDVRLVVTIPKVSQIAAELVKKILKALGI